MALGAGCIDADTEGEDTVLAHETSGPRVTVDSSRSFGVFGGLEYTYVEATMKGRVKRATGADGQYSVGLVLIYPKTGGNKAGIVDWPNSVYYSMYGFDPNENMTLQMTRASSDNYVFENGYTYASVQWNKAVTEIFGPTMPSGPDHNRLVYGTIEKGADSWQILSDAARFLRKPAFAGSTVAPPRATERVLSSGYSQTAALQLEYLSTGRNVGADGKTVYDGFLVQMIGLLCYQRNDEAPVYGNFAPCASFPRAGKARVIVAGSETDFDMFNSYGSRADGTDPNYMQYELAGISHIPKPVIDVGPFGATRQNHATSKPFVRGAIRNLHKWVTAGKRPPSAPAIDGTFDGTAFTMARDADGNVTGGLRFPHMKSGAAGAPSGTYTGVEPAGFDPFHIFLLLSGTYEKFADASLVARYPTCASYTTKVAASANALYDNGFITLSDRDAYITGTPELASTSAWSFTCSGSACTCQDN
ncbi:MAG: alpha/beta hydrolase domain-containing protein [Myxococcota bacterium]|nr:alpha/beta hydrolase domain-containing protein [Myxococcota bacterium]